MEVRTDANDPTPDATAIRTYVDDFIIRGRIAMLRRMTREELAAIINPHGFEFFPSVHNWEKDDAIAEIINIEFPGVLWQS